MYLNFSLFLRPNLILRFLRGFFAILHAITGKIVISLQERLAKAKVLGHPVEFIS